MAEPAIQVIEGRRTRVAPTGSGLPQKMPDLLAQMFSVTYRDDFALAGARPDCDTLREHRFRRFREGRWLARQGINRGHVLDLVLAMCQDCGAVRVTDVSFDIFEGPVLDGHGRMTGEIARIPPGRRGPNRRNHILDWYSGQRANARTYSGSR